MGELEQHGILPTQGQLLETAFFSGFSSRYNLVKKLGALTDSLLFNNSPTLDRALISLHKLISGLLKFYAVYA
jgi:hypothetical protein